MIEKVTEIAEKLANIDIQEIYNSGYKLGYKAGYEAGYAKGYEEGGISTNPTFTLVKQGQLREFRYTVEFEPGMTWDAFMNSEYNTYFVEEYMGSPSIAWNMIWHDDMYPSTMDFIVEGAEYRA